MIDKKKWAESFELVSRYAILGIGEFATSREEDDDLGSALRDIEIAEKPLMIGIGHKEIFEDNGEHLAIEIDNLDELDALPRGDFVVMVLPIGDSHD